MCQSSGVRVDEIDVMFFQLDTLYGLMFVLSREVGIEKAGGAGECGESEA
jgi:hypothetical protein